MLLVENSLLLRFTGPPGLCLHQTAQLITTISFSYNNNNFQFRQGHLGSVTLLMQYGADPSHWDAEGCACIHVAAQLGHTSIVAYLIAKGTSPNVADKSGMTPLMWSCHKVTRYVTSLYLSSHLGY